MDVLFDDSCSQTGVLFDIAFRLSIIAMIVVLCGCQYSDSRNHSREKWGCRMANETVSRIADKSCVDDSRGLEKRAAVVKEALHRRGSFTEIMYKVLDYCKARRSYADVEAQIAKYPEFKYVDQSQASIIEILVHAGALKKIELDKQDEEVDDARRHGLSDDELDELVWSFALETTDAGVLAIAGMAPNDRLSALFAKSPERVEVYREILRACKRPKTFKEIESLLDDMPKMASLNKKSSLPVFPSALVAELEGAGGLVWDDAWILMSAGESFA